MSCCIECKRSFVLHYLNPNGTMITPKEAQTYEKQKRDYARTLECSSCGETCYALSTDIPVSGKGLCKPCGGGHTTHVPLGLLHSYTFMNVIPVERIQ
jgi:hypothetical protein